MSTPISVDPPVAAHLRTDSEQERDLQEKIQRMISLQQQYSSREVNDEEEGDFLLGEALEEGDYARGFEGNSNRIERVITSAEGLSLADRLLPAHFGRSPAQPPQVPWPSEHQIESSLPPISPHSGIGRGTLVFPSNFDHRRRVSNATSDGDHYVNDGLLMSATNNNGNAAKQFEPQRPSSPPPPPQQFPPTQIYAGYGTLGATASGQEQMPLNTNTTEDLAASLPVHEHEFHYGNPDVRSPYQDDDGTGDPSSGRSRPEDSLCARFCCLYVPIANLLMQENVHRSFCYGSIDGILTGSGLASAFCALGVLSGQARMEVRMAVVAFTLAACMADAVCMAMGHIWTSYVVSSGHARERANQRQQLDANKRDAKARLVDMLLARGMLKIDAMSLADTLEGYPDMFVNALMGDSLLAGAGVAEDETDDDPQSDSLGRTNNASALGMSWNFPSYGQFNEMDHEPETGNLNAIVKESQMEGFFMMLGFSLFSLIPSLLWLVLPRMIDGDSASHAKVASKGTSIPVAGDDVVSVASLVVSISGFIMWFLGVWKSQFLDSHWVMSGIENVIVLLACVLVAYGVGYSVCHAIGGEEGVTLTNVVY